MENDKSPGIDGIPIEFYEIFYEFLEQDLLQLYNKKIYQNNKPSHYYFNSKKGNLNKHKYWRPTSLLCLDYKILTKILANKLKKDSPDDYIRRAECLNTTNNHL